MTVRIVGREPELRQFGAARNRVRSGTSATFVVESGPGIGKTRLLDELRADASRDGFIVVEWRCAELDIDRPFVAAFSGLDELVADLVRQGETVPFELDEARKIFRRSSVMSAGVVARDETPDSSSPNGETLSQLVIDGLLDLAGSRSMALLVDDAQWIDNASSRILWGLSGRRRSVPLLTVVALRPERREEVQVLRRGLESQGATNLILGGLLDGDSEDLIAELVGPVLNGSVVDERKRAVCEFALKEARGNPLFITELLRSIEDPADESAIGDSIEIPKSLRALITRRFDSLSVETKSVLRQAAVLGAVFDISELGIVAREPLWRVLDMLGPAIDLGVLIERTGHLSFQHSIVHRIVLELQPLAIRSALHVEIARSLANAKWSATRVAEHFFLGASGPSEEASLWLRAASREVRSLSLEAALAWAQRARSCCTPESFFETNMEVVGLLIRMGRLDDAERICLTMQGRTMRIEEEIRFRLSYSALMTNSSRSRDSEAIDHLDWVRSALSPADPQQIELLGWKAVLMVLRGYLDKAERFANEALELEVTGDRSVALGWALEALGLIAMLRGDTNDALRFSTESSRTYFQRRNIHASGIMPHYVLGMAMFSSAPIHDVIAMLQEGMDLCDPTGHRLARSHLEPLMAVAYASAGQLDVALSVVDAAVLRTSNWGDTKVALPTGTALAAQVALLRDDPVSAGLLAQRAFSELTDDGATTGSGDFVIWCVANVAEASGDITKARDLLVGVWELYAKDASLYLIAPDLVRLTQSDRRDFAEDVVARCEARATRSGAAFDRANALASRGFLERNIAMLDQARLACDELNWKLIPTRLSGLALELLDPKRDRLELQRRLNLIISEWDLMEAPQPVRVLRERYGNFVKTHDERAKPTSGPDSLSQAERNVVRLVSEGLTNKEIAHRLYISHRTVDTHVSHALAKLDCKSRVQLVSIFIPGLA